MSQILGVDVSDNNGTDIDWAEAYRAGVRVAYVKATQGVSYRNELYHAQVTGARGAGIAVGAYHFSEPASTTPDEAWAYFVDFAKTAPTNLPPMADDESSGGLSWSALKTWMQTWLNLAGSGALHYSDASYLDNLGPLGRQWTSRPGAKGLVSPDFATQVSLGSRLAGFPGLVDLDYFNSSILGDPPTPPEEEQEMQAGIQAVAGGQYLIFVSPTQGLVKQAIGTTTDITQGLEKMGAVATGFSEATLDRIPTIPGVA